jgi:hypothetical protein
MDLLADEMDRLRIWRDGGTHAIRRRSFLVLRRAAVTILIATPTGARGAALATVPATAISKSPVTIVAPGRAFLAPGECLGFALGLVASVTRPCRPEGKAGQETVQWIGLRITHGAKSKERI